MPRPRAYETHDVVELAKLVFWTKGFDATSISDLEQATGLSRSSLYHAFGSKLALYERCITSYISDFVDPMLAQMEHGEACPSTIAAYFGRLAGVFRSGAKPMSTGCLIFNALGSSPPRGRRSDGAARRLQERLARAFERCLGSAGTAGRVRAATSRRVSMLVAATVGVWQVARSSPRTAAEMCDDLSSEVLAWEKAAART